MGSIWREEHPLVSEKTEQEVDNFFENLQGSKIVEYRESQHTMALDVLEAIKKREILLIEAGVGSGKTWGYLVPLLYASEQQEKFEGFIISTSSIALQNQIKREVEKLSATLGIHIPVTIAKGRCNYLCQKRLEMVAKNTGMTREIKQIFSKLKKGYVDKEDYSEISAPLWKKINVDKTNCTKCMHKNYCGYVIERQKWPNCSYVICNHDLLIENLKRDTDDRILKEPSFLVIDEAHTFEEKLRTSYQKSLEKEEVEALIHKINFQIHDEEDIAYYYKENPIVLLLNQVFRKISVMAKQQYQRAIKNNIENLENGEIGFRVSNALKESLDQLNQQLTTFIKEAESYAYSDLKLIQAVKQLKEYNELFKDLKVGGEGKISDQKNIYWVNYLPNTKDHVRLEYVRKDIKNISTNLLGNPNYGKVFTSATLTTARDDYHYFANSLGIDDINGIPVTREFSLPSPYDYEKNALLYLSSNVLSPKTKNREDYIDSLAQEVDTLIETTSGRSLVLFTSKKDMIDTYRRVALRKHSFPLFLQQDGESADHVRRKFTEDIDSTLFATGSFWEGIDVKGASLENVIITKLPFPIVTPVIEEKASYYTHGFKEVYLPEMLIQLKQGTGRLIRSATDKGIVSILDSRAVEYKKQILSCLPFTNYTQDMDEVSKFASKRLGKTR